jgi:hypothetical protein
VVVVAEEEEECVQSLHLDGKTETVIGALSM